MDREDITRMAREAGFVGFDGENKCLREFAALVRAAEHEKVAAWMMQRGFATGHGDTVDDLLNELEWQVAEREREACAKVADLVAREIDDINGTATYIAAAIRARGQE